MCLRQQNENPIVPPPQPKMKVHQNWRGNDTDGCPESSPLLEAPMGFLRKVTVPNQPSHAPRAREGRGTGGHEGMGSRAVEIMGRTRSGENQKWVERL